MNTVLIVDDEIQICTLLALHVTKKGHRSVIAHSISDALNEARTCQPSIVFLDVYLPDGTGLDAIAQFKQLPNAPEIIIMTGAGDTQSAENAIRRGAWSYVLKGPSLDPFADALDNALSYRLEQTEKFAAIKGETYGIIGSSTEILACLDRANEAAQTDASVLITGETGTGKELLARAIHAQSKRKTASFVVVDCTAIPESVVESIVFGHAKGSFTGADRAHDGLIKQADGGTLFIDEVGELPATLQRPFLRVLQDHRFRPVGSESEVYSSFRLISATHRDLDGMATLGAFRQDLLYRLRAVYITLPPLRARTGDVEEIARHHISRICDRYRIPLKSLSDEIIEALNTYQWPGNVRELVQAMESAVTAARDRDTLFSRHLPEHIHVAVVKKATESQLKQHPVAEPLPTRTMPTLKSAREAGANQAEREYLQKLIEHAKGNVEVACEVSELSRSRLYALLQKHGLSLGRN